MADITTECWQAYDDCIKNAARNSVFLPCANHCKQTFEDKPLLYKACVQGCHAAQQAAMNVCSTDLDRCLGRDPREKPRYEDRQKDRFGPNGDIFVTVGAAELGLGVAVLSLNPVGAAAIIGGFLMGLGGGFLIGGMYCYGKAADPIDPNFTSRARPRPPKPFFVKAQSGTPIDADVAKAMNAVLENQAKAIGVDRALMTSVNRAQGAAAAQDKKYEKLQMKYARSYAGELAILLRQSAGLRSKAASTLRDNDVIFSLTAEEAYSIRGALLKNGLPPELPPELKRILSQYCENADERKEVILRFVSKFPDARQPEATFPDIFSRPKLASAEKKVASALEEFSKSTYISL